MCPLRRVDRYLVAPPLAVGGMATVHLARLVGPIGFSRVCALKRLHAQFARDPEVVAMLVDEARLAARIRHPNVAAVLDVVSSDGELLVALEYVHGLSLAELRRDALVHPPPVPIALAIVEQALQGLHAAHETRGEEGALLHIVHRDVSPQNVVLGTDGLARVVDFGIAKARWRAQSTHAGQLKGKLGYMAPEQLAGAAVDRRADVFAAGVVAWELLTGRRIGVATDLGEALSRLRGFAPTPVSTVRHEVPPRIDEILARALAIDPDERWPTAEAMARAIREAVTPVALDDIGRWLREVGGPALAEREAALHAIETVTITPETFRRVPLLTAETQRSSEARVPEPGSATESVLTRTGEPPRTRRGSRRLGTVVAATTALVTLLAFAYARVRGGNEAEARSPVTAPSTPEPAEHALATAPLLAAPSAPSPAATSVVAPLPVAPAKAKSAPRPSSGASPAKSACDPPWTIDALGVRTYKAQCL